MISISLFLKGFDLLSDSLKKSNVSSLVKFDKLGIRQEMLVVDMSKYFRFSNFFYSTSSVPENVLFPISDFPTFFTQLKLET